MYIICNLVNECNVGQKHLRVLGSVPILSDNFGKNQCYEFNPLEFKAVNTQSINDIEIDLVSDNGFDVFPISSGRVQIKVLFRKKRILL